MYSLKAIKKDKNGAKTEYIPSLSWPAIMLKLDNSNNYNEDTLECIINFTSEFKDKNEMAKGLISVDYLPKEFAQCDFLIECTKKDGTLTNREAYLVSYKHEKKYYDIDYLVTYYQKQLTNLQFMNLFLQRFGHLADIKNNPYGDLVTIRAQYKTFLDENRIYGVSSELAGCMEAFIRYYSAKAVTVTVDKNKSKKRSTKELFGNVSFASLARLADFAILYERNPQNIIDLIEYNKKNKANKKNQDVIEDLNRLNNDPERLEQLIKDHYGKKDTIKNELEDLKTRIEYLKEVIDREGLESEDGRRASEEIDRITRR